LVNPTTGNNAVTFSPAVTVVKGTTYYLAINQDASWTANLTSFAIAGAFSGTTTYASFPVASPGSLSGSGISGIGITITITPGNNCDLVAEPQQDGVTSYVFDSTATHADFYNVAGIGSTPSLTVAVTTRGYVQKSDSGPRSTAMQLKSGSTTVQSTPAGGLSAGVWTWLYRTDIVDPNTSAAWTATAVNSAQIGPVIVS
jgi:hypothetical protein